MGDGRGGHPRRAAVVLAIGALACSVVGVVCSGLTTDAPDQLSVTPLAISILLGLSFSADAVFGALIVRRADGHPVGWLLTAAGGLFAAGLAAENAAKLRAAEGALDTWTAWASWLDAWAWTMGLACSVIAVALFPHRRPGGRLRSSVVVVLATAATLGALVAAFSPGRLDGGSHEDNPLGIAASEAALDAVAVVAEALFALGVVATAVLVVVRLRTATDEVRQQMRWLVLAVVTVAVTGAAAAIAAPLDVQLQALPFLAAVVGIPAAMAVAILRYHLYDIDLVVNRLVLYSLLVATITAAYVVVAVTTKALLAGDANATSVTTIIALIAVSVVTIPARERLQRLADRIAFGRRATPYHALAEFAEHAAAAGSIEGTSPRLAALLVDATGADLAVVYLRVRDELVPHAGADVAPVPIAEATTALAHFDLVQVVERRGEQLGAIALAMPPGTPVRNTERRLVTHLAAQAALSFESLRTTAELARAADELRRSRERLVSAQDAERRRIGRDLHDGAQQHLVGIIAKTSLARAQLTRRPDRADATLVELNDDAVVALNDIRELVHGIFPQILADRGLVEAIESRVERLLLDVRVVTDPSTRSARFPPGIESAAWFVVAEGLTNTVKHAGATRASVHLSSDDGRLTIEIADDGVGIDGAAPGNGLTNMRDRVGAVGGQFDIASSERGGTIVRCSLPVGP
jgi:signal transduction histidine kinase